MLRARSGHIGSVVNERQGCDRGGVDDVMRKATSDAEEDHQVTKAGCRKAAHRPFKKHASCVGDHAKCVQVATIHAKVSSNHSKFNTQAVPVPLDIHTVGDQWMILKCLRNQS